MKRSVAGTFVNSPGIARLAIGEKIEAYALPQGAMSQLMREMAAGRAGLLTKIGLHTFVDPRLGGGRQSRRATEDLVEVQEFRGEECLFYRPFIPNVAFVRGSASDENGNISMEHEAVTLKMLSIAQATRRVGGLVVAQVKRLVPAGTLHPKMVKVPGILVDAVVVAPDQWQTYETEDSAAYSGHQRVSLAEILRLPPGSRRVVARRGAQELFEGAICNLGSGISTGIANVAAEEEILHRICLTNEQGNIGGAPASGNEAGAAISPDAQVDPVRVNRTPVLTLWAAVVAEHLGHPPDTALSLASAVAATAARAKARRLGIAEETPRGDRLSPPRRATTRLLGRNVPLTHDADGVVLADAGGGNPRRPARPLHTCRRHSAHD